jgi:hypothetical protein
VFKVQISTSPENGEQTVRDVFCHQQIASQWQHHRVDLSPCSGQTVTLRFVVDAGPGDDSVMDHVKRGRVLVGSSDQLESPPLPEQFMSWNDPQSFTSYSHFEHVRSKTVDLTFAFEGSQQVDL